MEKLRYAAFLSVGRAVGFAGFGIFTLMFGLSYEPVLALRCGGVLILVLLVALLIRAYRVPRSDFRHTETWVLIPHAERPDERYAGLLVTSALREAYLWFARWIAGVAALIWAAAVLLTWTAVAA
jgi:hypothetical protein